MTLSQKGDSDLSYVFGRRRHYFEKRAIQAKEEGSLNGINLGRNLLSSCKAICFASTTPCRVSFSSRFRPPKRHRKSRPEALIGHAAKYWKSLKLVTSVNEGYMLSPLRRLPNRRILTIHIVCVNQAFQLCVCTGLYCTIHLPLKMQLQPGFSLPFVH